MVLDGHQVTIIGVAPEGFQGNFVPVEMDAFVPLQLVRAESQFVDRDVQLVRVIARTGAGITMPQAQASLDTVTAQLERAYPTTNAGRRARVYPERLARPEPGNANQTLVVVSFVVILVGIIFLIACANVLGLFLARGVSRGRELAVRAAMGARRGQLIRASLVEAFLICLCGAIVADRDSAREQKKGSGICRDIPGYTGI